REARPERAPRPSRAAGALGAFSSLDLAGKGSAAAAFVSARRTAFAGGAGVIVLVVVLLSVLGGGSESPAVKTKKSQAAARKAAEAKWAKSPYGVPTDVKLPPKTRIVAYAGAPHAKALGILGTTSFKNAAAKLKTQSAPYARPTRHVLRAYDLIATVASAAPGPSGKYRTRQTPSTIARYLRAARRDHAALILDIQPGQSNFVDELKPLERWLREPDVQLALDPEWRMRPGVVPGTEIGYVSGGELNATLARVGAIIKAGHLPDKMVLVHRFTDGMIKNFGAVKVPKGIVPVISIDGVGAKANKIATYDRIAPSLPKPWLPGFKLFYQEDNAAGGIMSGKQVMGLKPRPHVVLYE
ncbi:MAG: hypothetical protein REI11_12360, partial [Patulibacter sp.]|nr:hypothetical protein [Patulibacter sp.]